MKKFLSITSAIAFATVLFYSDTAYAQHRPYAPAPHYAPHHAPHYAPQRRSVAPYVLGGAALGILGGAIITNEYYRPYCHPVLVEQRWDGYRWVPIYETVCD